MGWTRNDPKILACSGHNFGGHHGDHTNIFVTAKMRKLGKWAMASQDWKEQWVPHNHVTFDSLSLNALTSASSSTEGSKTLTFHSSETTRSKYFRIILRVEPCPMWPSMSFNIFFMLFFKFLFQVLFT